LVSLAKNESRKESIPLRFCGLERIICFSTYLFAQRRRDLPAVGRLCAHYSFLKYLFSQRSTTLSGLATYCESSLFLYLKNQVPESLQFLINKTKN
jgi:hypothetical protein